MSEPELPDLHVDGERLWRTLHELADEYRVSAERIRQIESNAFKTIKGSFAA